MDSATSRPFRFRSCCLAALCGLLIGAQPLRAGIDQSFDCVVEPKSVVELGTAEEGIVTDVLVERGDVVSVGQKVAKLDSELQELQLRALQLKAGNETDVDSSQAKLDFRNSELRRVSDLHNKQIVATKNRDEVLIERDLAEHALEAAKLDRQMAVVEMEQAQARLSRRTVRAPVSGIVTEVALSAGEYAHEQVSIAHIAEIDPLYVEVFVPIRFYGQVREGDMAEVRPEAPIGGAYRAKVLVVDRVFDAASRTFGVRLELKNDDHSLPAGMRCRIEFLPTNGKG